MVLAGVWWVRGGRGWRIDAETIVDAPPDRVFAILDDPANAPRLNPRIVRTEPLSPGRLRHHLRVGLRDVVIETLEFEREPPRLSVSDVVVVRVRGRPIDAGTQRQTFALEPAPEGGTRVRLEIRGRPGNAWSRIAIGSRNPIEQRAARRVLRRLRDYASAPERSR